MARKQPPAASAPTSEQPAADPGVQTSSALPAPVKDKPVHEIRLGRIKAVIWVNRTEAGLRHNVTLKRLYKPDSSTQWEQSEVFGRDDLLLVAEVCRMAVLWIYQHGQG